MKKYRIGNFTFEAQDLGAAIQLVRSKGLTGKLEKVADDAPLTDTTVIDRQVTVTCGWGKSTHKWETSVAEAIEFRNTCPDHR